MLLFDHTWIIFAPIHSFSYKGCNVQRFSSFLLADLLTLTCSLTSHTIILLQHKNREQAVEIRRSKLPTMISTSICVLSAVACSLQFHVNAEYTVQFVCELDSTLGFGFSDHLICYSVFNWKSIPPPLKTSVASRSYKSFSPSQFQSDLDAVPWSLEVFDDPDNKLNVFNLLLKDVVDKCAPLVKKKQRKCLSPWITNDLRRKMMHRNRLYWKFVKSRSQINLESYRAFRNHVTSMLRKAKRFHLSNLVKKQCYLFHCLVSPQNPYE